MKKKIFWSYFLIYEVVGFIFFTVVQLCGDNNQRALNWLTEKKTGSFYLDPALPFIEHIFIPASVVFISYKIYNSMAKFDAHNSDEINDNNIFIVFRYPKNFIGLLICILTPLRANTVCLYYCGFLYKFKKTESGIIKEKSCCESLMTDDYFLKDTKISDEKKILQLEDLIGIRWTLLKNCITVFQQVVGPLKQYIR